MIEWLSEFLIDLLIEPKVMGLYKIDFASVDYTKERVDDGRLKLIQIYPYSTSSITAIIFSCDGSQLNSRQTERSLI